MPRGIYYSFLPVFCEIVGRVYWAYEKESNMERDYSKRAQRIDIWCFRLWGHRYK